MPRRPRRPRYQAHPLLAREGVMKARLETDTGRSWDDWISLARRSGVKDAKALKARLLGHLGLKPMAASWIAHEAVAREDEGYDAPERLVDALYSGDKEALRPVQDALADAFLALGDDVVVTACKTMVPVYRKHALAQMRPVRGGVELRLAMGNVKPIGRLRPVSDAQMGERMTHVVHVADPKEIDGQLRAWMSVAYAQGTATIARGDIKVPPDLAKALKGSGPAAATWATMTPAMRREMSGWVLLAKQDATRTRRIATAVAKLADGHKRIY